MVDFDALTLLRVGVPVASGGAAGFVGLTVYRRLRRGTVNTSLARPFLAFAVVTALIGVIHGVLRVTTPLGSRMIWIGIFLSSVPWMVFAARYVGAGRYITRWRIVAGTVVVLVVSGVNTVGMLVTDGYLRIDWLDDSTLQTVETAQSVVSLGILTLVFAMMVGVVVATYRHERLPTLQGVVVAAPIGEYIFAVQATRPSTPFVNDVLAGGAFLAVAASLVAGITYYDLLERVPATRRLGERAALTEIDEAVLVVDDEDRIVRANVSAEKIFGEIDTIADVTDHSVRTLAERKTITCWTTAGRKQFEPSVSSLVDDHGETLGHTVMLIDVTDREIQRQRLAVLNRILRHNVRNELDVIRAHAERADLAPAVQSVDDLGALSEEARRVQHLMEESDARRTNTDLGEFLQAVVADATTGTDAETSVSAPQVTVGIDRERCRYALEHLVENAVEHNDGASPRVDVRGERTASGVRVVVADDGPGIPESERAVIETGEETPLKHASSLGLWGANWAVQTMGGSLSFAESDLGGTAVTITLPDTETSTS